MASKLFVGNLPFTVTEHDLQDYFAQAGPVIAVSIMQDRATGRSRGFAFIEMGSEEDASKAITMLHKKDFQGRPLTVNEAVEGSAEERSPGGEVVAGYRDRGFVKPSNKLSQHPAFELLDSLLIEHPARTSRLSLYVGSLMDMPASEAVDVLVISSFPNDYLPTKGSLVGDLYRKGISVEELAKRKAVDLRETFSCWLSREI